MNEDNKNKSELILGEIIEQSEHYDVHIGRLPDDTVDQYIVVNRKYKVVEYATNSEYVFREYLPQIEERIAKQLAPKSTAEVIKLHADKH